MAKKKTTTSRTSKTTTKKKTKAKTSTKKKTTTKKKTKTTTRTVKRKTRKTATKKKAAAEAAEPATSTELVEVPEVSPIIPRDSDFGAGILLEELPVGGKAPKPQPEPAEKPASEPVETDRPVEEAEAKPARRAKKRSSRRRSGKTSKVEPVESSERKPAEEPAEAAPSQDEAGADSDATKPATEEAALTEKDAEEPRRTSGRRRGSSRRRRRKPATQTASSEEALPEDGSEVSASPGAGALTAGTVCATEPPTQTLDFDAIEAGKPALMEPVVEEVKPGGKPHLKSAPSKPAASRAESKSKTVAIPPPPSKSEDRVMLINVADPDECRITLLRDGRLDELYVERATSASNVGNIYKGVVTNVEPAIQAAFIDFGKPSHGFLHITDLHPQYFPNSKGEPELVGRKTPRRHRPPVQSCLKRGQEIIVQVIKEGIGTKGPTLSTYISVPGRFLVMMPRMDQLGVSRKIDDDDHRRKLRDMLNQLSLPKDMGFIVRTAGVDRTKRDLQRDLNYLSRLWKKVENRIKKVPAPAEMYRESDLVIRTIRDVFDSNLKQIVVDDHSVAARVRDFLAIASPRGQDIVKEYNEPEPLFHKYGVETEIDKLHSRRVPLPCGGSLIIEQTEALVAIDVNSGRFKVPENAEETAFLVNVEAVDEIARQLRLRDLGGLIICDLIDMGLEKHRRAIEKRLTDALKQHKERAKLLRISRFGILEMTRQRQRPSFAKSMFRECPTCTGSGRVKATDAVTLDAMRQIRIASQRENVASVDVCVALPVANDLLNRKRLQIAEFEKSSGLTIRIEGRPEFTIEQVRISCTDRRGREIVALPMEGNGSNAQRGNRNSQRHPRSKSRGRRGSRQRRPG